jgi:hypothetical protein
MAASFNAATSAEVLRLATGGLVTRYVPAIPVSFYAESIVLQYGNARVDVDVWWPPFRPFPVLCVRFNAASGCDAAALLTAASQNPQVSADMIEATALGLRHFANGAAAAAFLRANPDRFESVLLIGDQTDRERTPVMDHSYAEACFLLVLKRGGPEGSELASPEGSGLSGLSGLEGLEAVSEALLCIANKLQSDQKFQLLVA